MKKRSFTIILSFLFLLATSTQLRADVYGSGWYREIQLSYEHEDNVSRSYKNEDQVSDAISAISFGAGHLRKLGLTGQWIVSGYVSYHDHEEYDDLDNLAITGGFSWIHQPSIGYNALWYGVRGNASILRYRNSEAREGVFFDLDLSINRRLGTRMVGHLGYRYTDVVFLGKEEDEKSRDAAFDTAGNEIYFGIDAEIAPFVFLFIEYGFRHGGITSTVSGSIDPDVDYQAETNDAVFNECNAGLCSFRYAYRVVSDMHKVNLGIAFPIRQLNFDLTASYYDAEGDGGRSYRDWTVKLGVVWNF